MALKFLTKKHRKFEFGVLPTLPVRWNSNTVFHLFVMYEIISQNSLFHETVTQICHRVTFFTM